MRRRMGMMGMMGMTGMKRNGWDLRLGGAGADLQIHMVASPGSKEVRHACLRLRHACDGSVRRAVRRYMIVSAARSSADVVLVREREGRKR